MATDSIIIRMGDSELYAVPAIHYNRRFMEEVHRICADPEISPDAIAVELGPVCTSAVVQWLTDMGIGKRNRKLPIMLGLMKKNRLILPSLKEKALQLQKELGRDIAEFPADLLLREFGFAGRSIFFLSPVDSILEAIRCSLELNVPVFGVDLEESADGARSHLEIQSPDIGDSFASFINSNALYAERQRIEEVDLRREIAMVARLKSILQRHRRVLFTCGMAHWSRIRELLIDPAIAPAILPEPALPPPGEFTRVIVHPCMAAGFLDIFPAVAFSSEAIRRPVGRCSRNRIKTASVDMEKLFNEQMQSAYREYFGDNDLHTKGKSADWTRDFESYLRNLGFLLHHPVPNLAVIFDAAREIANEEFVQVLADSFMKYPWASPDDFPDTPLLCPAGNGSGEAAAEIVNCRSLDKETIHYHPVLAGQNDTGSLYGIPFHWVKTLKSVGIYCNKFTWLPWDRLLTSMALRAMANADRKIASDRGVVFEGNLLNGIDVKRTVRSFSRGGGDIYVREPYLTATGLSDDIMDDFPVVFIFDPADKPGYGWKSQIIQTEFMSGFVEDKSRFARIVTEEGDEMVVVIGYGNKAKKPSSDNDISLVTFSGILLYHPAMFSNGQHTCWAEACDFKQAPFCDYPLMDSPDANLAKRFREKHGISIGEHSWTTSLILMAIPYARRSVTVVVPHGYRIEETVYRKAKEYGVDIYPVSLNLFSTEERERAVKCHYAPVLTLSPDSAYSESVEKEIGERQTDNLHLIPTSLQNFGNWRNGRMTP
jgi:hypothetical protein